jgi:hypothetical protein
MLVLDAQLKAAQEALQKLGANMPDVSVPPLDACALDDDCQREPLKT